MKSALVTGASSGIGLNIAIALARRGYFLILLGRNHEELHQLSLRLKRNFLLDSEVIVADLCNEENLQLVFSSLYKYRDNLEILVNNAGFGIWGKFAGTTVEDQVKMIQLNNAALVQLTHYALEIFQKKKNGYILNIGSTAAFQAVPGMAVYSASKAFVNHFSRALATELKRSGISVTCVHPGATDTAFVERAGMGGSHLEKQAERFNMKAEDVAELAVAAMFKKKVTHTTGLVNQLNYFISVLLPNRLLEYFAARLYLMGK